MNESDEELGEVFKLLYPEDEDWGVFDDDKGIQPKLNDIAPALDLENVEVDISENQESTEKYSKKRYIDALDSLLNHSPKRQRVFTPHKTPSSPYINPEQPIPIDNTPYSPFSYLSHLARLRTFKPSTFSSFPNPFTPRELALKGWINDGRERLRCRVCQVTWILASLNQIADDRVKNEVAKRMGGGLTSQHKSSCAWRITSCPRNLVDQIRHNVHPMLTSSLSTLTIVLELSCHLNERKIDITSPLFPSHISNLTKNLQNHIGLSSSTQISQTAATLALFGWYPYPPNAGDLTKVHIEPSYPHTEIVCCRICLRRVGLWHFTEGRHFDVIDEHLNWCPIRPQEGKWWGSSSLLKEKAPMASEDLYKSWVQISEKLEEKPWRRKRQKA